MAKAPRTPAALSRQLTRGILRDGLRPNEARDAAFRRAIRSIPKGRVATYGQVAAAAGYPLYHRAVARLLRTDPVGSLPWQRVVGAGGAIKVPLSGATEQRLLLQMEGVKFKGPKVDLAIYQHEFRVWEFE